MVARALVFAGGLVYLATLRLGFQSVADQNVVNAQPTVAPESKIPVVPPAVTLWRLRK
jgi:hypothetical protein